MPPIPYLHVAQTVYLRPWAIRREVHDQIRAILRSHVEQGHLAAEDVRERLAAAPQRTGRGAGLATVARIPIHGVIIPRASMFAEMSGATSVELLRERFRAALDNSEVDAIVFDVDSPGGVVDGVPEMADEIRAARGRKPMLTCFNTIGASAAYWLGCQADEIAITPSGEAGSIGVFSAHEDWSAFWEEFGVKTTLISAGKYKVEGNQFEPLGEEAEAHYQSLTNDYYDMFTRGVAAARGVTPAEVRAGYGQGRMFTAKRAVTEKLVDRIATLEETEQRAARQGAASRVQRDRSAAIAATKLLPAEERQAEWARMLQEGEVTVNDVRAAEGFEPLALEDGMPWQAITDRQVELEEKDEEQNPDHDDGEFPTDDGAESEASAPPREWYALRARRRDRAAAR